MLRLLRRKSSFIKLTAVRKEVGAGSRVPLKKTMRVSRNLWNPKIRYSVHWPPSWVWWSQLAYSHHISLRYCLISSDLAKIFQEVSFRFSHQALYAIVACDLNTHPISPSIWSPDGCNKIVLLLQCLGCVNGIETPYWWKVKLFLCTFKHHAMKAYGGEEV